MSLVLSVVGHSNSGKTTLIEKLIPEIKGRGFKIGVLKHASSGIDRTFIGKDSCRYKEAGANIVAVSSPMEFIIIKDVFGESLKSNLGYFKDVDLVIVEGFKYEQFPKIEVFRSVISKELICLDDINLVAIVTDKYFDVSIPQFKCDNIIQLSDFIEQNFLKM